jgi:hypothetical protein
LVQWLKAGFGFAVGAWIAAVVLFLPTVLLWLWWTAFFLQAALRGLSRH